MEEDTEYKKLPVDERCVHKLWKARIDGYEEAMKIFRGIDDEKSPEWNKFLGLIKKFVIDSHAMAQEKGLEAALIFIENAGNAGKTVGEVMSGIVAKCFSSPKAKIKDLAFQVALMYIEIEKQEAVVEELVKGFDGKNPKIVAASVVVVTQALREFGSKVVGVKPILKKIPVLLADRDKNVRDETKLLTVEIYRWIGAALKPHLATLPAILATELDGEFDKLGGKKAEPTRYLKSQQEKIKAVAAAGGDDADEEADGNDDGPNEEVDPMDLIDPVDILSKIPKDFFEKLESKKWQERKESLDALDTLLKSPKLEPGDYGDIIRALKKVLTKDTNVVLVALAGKCMANLAKGLSKKFSPYATTCLQGILEKFKEKKPNVVTALREATDAIYPSTSLEAIQEDVIEALNNKNPSVKAETVSFLARSFARTSPAALNKKMLKTLTTALLKTLNEPDPTVRDNSAEALGTLQKLLGEKIMGPYLADVDALKMVKIKECSDKAVILVKVSAPKKERPTTAPAKSAAGRAPVKGGSTEPKAVSRPATGAAGKKPAAGAAKKTASAGTVTKSGSSSKALPTERDLSPEEVDEKAAELLPSDVISGLADANWKNRLAAAESFLDALNGIDGAHSQVLIRYLFKKPGLKDTNFQVLKVKLDVLAQIIEKMSITTTTGDHILNDITVLLGDAKNSSGASQVLTGIADAVRLEYVVSKVISFAFEQKSPKVQAESLLWVSSAIKEFGFQVNPKVLIDDVKKAVQSINPAVRQASIQLVGVMYIYMGSQLAMFFENEKPAIKQQIQAEFDKNVDQKAQPPTRGVNNSNSKGSMDDDDGDDVEEVPMKLTDLLPRIDISPQITEALLSEISDKNWKTRNEGLTKLQAILNEAKLIKPSIGDLPQELKHRLVDSNAKIAQTALEICKQLAESMGPSCGKYVHVLFPGFLNGLGDNKTFIRAASISCINAWGEQCSYKEFFAGEMIAEALKGGSPALKCELWAWLAEKLPGIPPKSIPKDELIACLPFLYANICDRSVDVRKNANEAVLGCMLHLGYEAMFKALETQKPATKKTIQVALDKARPSLPVKPLPKGKQQAPIVEETKSTKTVQGKGQKGAAQGKQAAASRKKEDDVDTSPLLAVNNLKNQRLLDEQKLKVLKWSFTTPREEFNELLRDQMSTASVNKGLMANMFHDDFRYHLKVIEALNEDMLSNTKALVCNLDLILKWISLRFYDTNPSVLLKSLEYLHVVLQMLITNEYVLGENEGSSFLPHLLTKIGDPKDAVRNGVRSLFRQICLVYPYTKVFTYIKEGLTSKNARQRTECLDELGYLIESYGMGACQPSPQIALKEIARHISDRDNSVRNAALNCVVQAYFLVDERIYKLIGQLTEKDLSMLDERIKRAKRPRKPAPEVVVQKQPEQENVIVEEEDEIIEEDIEPEEPAPVHTYEIPKPQPPKPSGPFKLDENYINEIEKDWIRSDQWEKSSARNVDLAFLHSPLKVYEVNGVSYPADRLQQLMAHGAQPSPPMAHQLNYTMGSPQSGLSTSRQNTPNLPDIQPKLDPHVVKIVRSVGSQDSLIARAALNEFNDILESPEKQAILRDYEEMFIDSVTMQFKNLSQIPLSEAVVLYQPLLSIVFAFYTTRSLGKNVGVEPLKKLMTALVGLMADQKFPNNEDGSYQKVVNGVCLKILEKSNFTNMNCALIRLLKETCSGANLPKFTDLLMKCIWRNVKVMPEKSNELDYDAILCEVHEFMAALPSTWWQQRHSDTPYRTVKTIIHNMAQIKGSAILHHLNKIPTHSELYAYLIKVLKNIQKDPNATNVKSQSSSAKSAKRMTVQVHESMSAIFKLISDKETAKDGISRLYDFKKQNPEIDIEQFLQGANPVFKKFIDDGLAELEQQSGNKTENLSRILNENRSRSGSKQDADYWMERLNMIKKASSAQPDEDVRTDNRSSTENLTAIQHHTQKITQMKKEMPDQISSNRLEIMQRLAQIRSQK